MNACFNKAALYCLLAMLTLATMTGCSKRLQTSDEDLVDANMATVREVMSSDEESAIMLDIRSADSYRDEFIEGAVSAPMTTLRQDDIRLNDIDIIVVYGDDFNDVLGPAAAKKLRAFGYENVLLYRGGLADWKKNAGPTKSLR